MCEAERGFHEQCLVLVLVLDSIHAPNARFRNVETPYDLAVDDLASSQLTTFNLQLLF
jgi:hypothetical protein